MKKNTRIKEEAFISREDRLSAYIGFSGPETPKYLLANNFLAEFFRVAKDNAKKIIDEGFFRNSILVCEEDNERIKQEVLRSFEIFLRRFAGEDTILSHYKGKYLYFPLTLGLLRSFGKLELRHLLFNLLPNIEVEKEYCKLQKLLEEYFYGENVGVNSILAELFENKEPGEYRRKWNEPGRKWIYRGKISYKKLGIQFKSDLKCLLTHRYFKEMDFYKKYDYFATLLNHYVIRFILQKITSSDKRYILCQGTVGSKNLGVGEYHRACVQNYANIRDVFLKEIKEFYLQCLLKSRNKKKDIILKMEENEILVDGEIPFTQFVKEVFHSNWGGKLYESVKEVFKLEKGKENRYSTEKFIMYFIEASKAQGGSMIGRTSSVLSTCGKDMGFVFPMSQSRHKYFAFSPSLLEFHVRLYLAKINKEYAYLDHFLQYLEEKHRILLLKTERMDKALKKFNTKIPLQQFRRNEEDLLENLTGINCLVRLSDSGYVITLRERKGEFKLL